MERQVGDRTILDKFTEEFCEVIEKYCKYIICSGFVAIAHGRSRGTEDIDMIIEKIPFEKFKNLHEELLKKGFQCIQPGNTEKLYAYLKDGVSIRYVWKSKSFAPPEMEVKFAKDELDEEQIKERQKLPLTGMDIYFSSIESNIAFKEEFLRAEKDLEDARHLRIIYKGKFSEDKVNKIKEKIKIRNGKQQKFEKNF
jgi:hypothetical protein